MMIVCVEDMSRGRYYVTEPVKTGHVGTNYILSHSRSYLGTGINSLNSVTYTIKPIICLSKAETFMAIA